MKKRLILQKIFYEIFYPQLKTPSNGVTLMQIKPIDIQE